MAKPRPRSEDDISYQRGMEELRALLANPKEFERWANAMLDEARRRRR